MLNWRLIKQFPKYAVVLGVIIVSTGLFGFWWYFRRPSPVVQTPPTDVAPAKPAEDSGEKIAQRIEHLILANDDLIDIESGEVVAKNWLNGDRPLKIWFDEQNRKIIGRFERGFKRYALNGKEEALIGHRNGVLASEDRDFAIYAEQGDVWRADVDWSAFSLVNAKRLTSIGGFNDQFFAQGLVLATKKALVVLNMNQLLRVTLDNGEVTPMQVMVNQSNERRSPDGAVYMGDTYAGKGRAVYAYDVDSNSVKTAELPRSSVTSVVWAGKNDCYILADGQVLYRFDRSKGSFDEVMKIPLFVSVITEPSENGRFLICAYQGGAAFADLEKKKFLPLEHPAQNVSWAGADTIALSTNAMDSNLRGTWLLKLDGSKPVRVSLEPYMLDGNGQSSLLVLKDSGQVILGTRTGLFKMKPGEAQAKMFSSFTAPSVRLISIQKWQK